METKKEKRSFKKISIAALVSLAVIMGTFGGTWAYYGASRAMANPLRTPGSGVAIVEDFNPTDSFLPGETVVKKVAFQNTGDMDLYLRVKIPPSEGWYESVIDNVNGTETTVVRPVDEGKLLVSRVIKDWTEEWGNQRADDSWDDGTEWVTIGDYRYYKKILPAGGSTADILSSIKLDPAVSNDRHAADYSDKIYKLTFDAEAIPVYADGQATYGIEAEWKMTAEMGNEGILSWEIIQ